MLSLGCPWKHSSSHPTNVPGLSVFILRFLSPNLPETFALCLIIITEAAGSLFLSLNGSTIASCAFSSSFHPFIISSTNPKHATSLPPLLAPEIPKPTACLCTHTRGGLCVAISELLGLGKNPHGGFPQLQLLLVALGTPWTS